ncbi:hypothetical protein BJX70DRAFT_373619 [Aspergillus crustosus]
MHGSHLPARRVFALIVRKMMYHPDIPVSLLWSAVLIWMSWGVYEPTMTWQIIMSMVVRVGVWTSFKHCSGSMISSADS